MNDLFPKSPASSMKVAIVHDWLVTYAGAERVLTELLAVFPKSDIFSVIDFLSDADRKKIGNRHANTTFVQQLPFARTKYRNYLPLMPLAVEQLDLSSYDLIITSSHAVAKGVLTGPDQIHVCYIHSPIRYAWDLQHQYLRESGLTHGMKSWLIRWLLHRIRIWDSRTANGVDQFISNSAFISRRVRKVYGRDSIVIAPPVDVSRFPLQAEKEGFFLTASRMVPYKRMDLVVQAFAKLPHLRLIVAGDGPDSKKIRALAAPNITFVGYQSDEGLSDLMCKAKAFVFAAEEDFGIIPVEAQACGTPVIAFGKGGALETVIGSGPKQTGVFFYTQSADAICSAVTEFEKIADSISPINCRSNAELFSASRFRTEIRQTIDSIIFRHRPDLASTPIDLLSSTGL